MQFLRFNTNYFTWFILLFATETCIERFAHDNFVRPFVGDFLVVILLYCLVKSFTRTAVYPTAIAVFLFSWFVEWMQYFHWVDRLGLNHSYFASMLLGNYFSWADLLMYTLGILLVIVVEKIKEYWQIAEQ